MDHETLSKPHNQHARQSTVRLSVTYTMKGTDHPMQRMARAARHAATVRKVVTKGKGQMQIKMTESEVQDSTSARRNQPLEQL